MQSEYSSAALPASQSAAPSEGFWDDWFHTPGDLDDFIFFGEETPLPSER